MNKFIKVGTNEIMPVLDVYPYTYQSGAGKQVLRIIVDPTISTYEELYALLGNCENTISEYWEEEITSQNAKEIYTPESAKVLKSEHMYYSKNYKCSYNSEDDYPNAFFIELTRKTEAEILTKNNQDMIDLLNSTIVDMYETTAK